MLSENMPLPSLREELKISEINKKRGVRRWQLYDPIRNSFFILGEADVSLLTLWHCGSVKALRKSLSSMGASLDIDGLEELINFLIKNQLVVSVSGYEKNKTNNKVRLLSNVLDRFRSQRFALFQMKKILWCLEPIIKIFSTRCFFISWIVISVFGIYFTALQWDVLIVNIERYASIKTLPLIILSLVFVKFFHECGHAAIANKFECRVGRLGVATFFMIPMFYTELDGVTRLKDRFQRAWVSSGGILVELIIAGFSTFLWSVSDDGVLRDIFLILATTSLLTSILINLNPFAKFDGYYLLSDILDIDNLMKKAIAWKDWFFDIIVIGKAHCPNELMVFDKVKFVSFGVLVQLYQILILMLITWSIYLILGLFWGTIVSSLMIYHFLFKAIFKKILFWWNCRDSLTELRKTFYIMVIIILPILALYPFESTIMAPGIARAEQIDVITAPADGRLEYISRDKHIDQGELVYKMYSPELDYDYRKASLALNIAQERLAHWRYTLPQRELLGVYAEEVNRAEAEVEAIQVKRESLSLTSNSRGRLVDVPHSISEGDWVKEGTELGRVLSEDTYEVIGFVHERDINRIKKGARATFYPDDSSFSPFKLSLIDYDQYAIDHLNTIALDQAYGGVIRTTEDESGHSIPREALHRVVFNVDGSVVLNQQLSGQISLEVSAQSFLQQSAENFVSLLFLELRR